MKNYAKRQSSAAVKALAYSLQRVGCEAGDFRPGDVFEFTTRYGDEGPDAVTRVRHELTREEIDAAGSLAEEWINGTAS